MSKGMKPVLSVSWEEDGERRAVLLFSSGDPGDAARIMLSRMSSALAGSALHSPGDPEFAEYLAATPEADVALRRALSAAAVENVQLYDILSHAQERCTRLMLRAREMRRKILELGGDDPGLP